MSRAVHELEVSLRYVAPRVWRCLRVPSDTRLDDLHRVLQVAMGWEDYHLHLFEVGGARYGVPDPDWDDDETRDETEVRLLDVAPGPGDRLRYEYDFGDCWEHDLVVRDVRRLGRGEPAYAVLGGAGACPPEDVGGAPGYEELLAAAAEPDHPRHDELLDWVGGSWDPHEFDVEAADADVRSAVRRGRRVRAQRGHGTPLPPADPEREVDELLAELARWWRDHPAAALPPDERPLWRDDPGPDPDSVAGRVSRGDPPPLPHGRPVDPDLVDLELLRPVLRAKTVAAVGRTGVLDRGGAGADLGEGDLIALARGLEPATWTADELAEVLLDVLPAVAPVDVASGARLGTSLRVFVRFLALTGRLDPGGDGRHLLEEALDDVEVELAAAMEPPQSYGLSSQDEDLVRGWRRRMAERRLAEGRGLTPTGPPRLRAAVPLPAEDLRAAAVAAPSLALLARLVAWLGDGRRVTAKGNVTVADAKALVEVLTTGDTVDSSYGREVRTRSVDDLPGVSFLVRLAEAADVVRRQGSRLVPGPTVAVLRDDPLGAWYRVAAEAFRVPLRAAVRLAFDEMAVAGLPLALAVAADRDGRITFAELSDLLWWRTRRHWAVQDADELYHQGRREVLDALLWKRLRVLELVGALTLGERDGEPSLELTPLGGLGLRAVLAASGLDAPVAGALAGRDPRGLAAGVLALDDPELVVEELRRWVAARADAAAAAELASALSDAGVTEDERHVLLAALQEVGVDGAPEVARLEAVPGLRPYVRLWQIERGLATREALSAEGGAAAMVDVLAVTLAGGGPDAVVADLGALGPPEEVARVVAELWRAEGPQTVPVLEAVAESADKQVAKAARKAAFKARSRG